MIFAVVNLSSLVSNDEASLMTIACQRQMTNHLAPWWGRAPGHLIYSGKTPPPKGTAQQLVILDHADQADALGYHDETPDGESYSRVFAEPVMENGGAALYGSPFTVSSVLSHEMCEQFVDPSCNSWCDGEIDLGGQLFEQVALEVCDPVESGSYGVMAGRHHVAVSDFVGPAWFDPFANDSQHFNWLGGLSAPFTCTPGGYLIVRDTTGSTQAVWGGLVPQWKKATKGHKAARSYRRSDG